MFRRSRITVLFAALGLLGISACATLQQIAALRTLTFEFTRVSDVRLVGIPIGAGSTFSGLGMVDAARLGAAILAKQAPIELVAHVNATNPAANQVTARMVELGWTLFVDDRRTLAGDIASPVAIGPGSTVDVPLSVRFDLFQLGSGGARDLYDIALTIAGQGSVKKDLRLDLEPTVETSLGPIRFSAPVVVRRGTASHRGL